MPLVFNLTRHFLLLGAFAIALEIAGPRPGSGIVVDFACFGALHATALALSIGAGAGISPLRRFGFIPAAGLLAGLNAQLALFGGRAAATFAVSAAPVAILALSAGFGALGYAILVRLLLIDSASRGGSTGGPRLAAAVLGCAAATTAGFILARELHQTGLIWLAAPWWFAFSGSLAMPIRSQNR